MHKGMVLFLDKVTSTQDAAVEHDLQIGEACVSYNQTQGRGRRGNQWNSSGGIALTVVVETITAHMSIALAATLAAQLNNLIPEKKIGIKWPNDLFVRGQKIAGILIEQRADRYLVGIGINVLEAPIPSATCLRECGSDALLPVVVDVAIGSVFDAAQLNENTAVSEWKKRDILMGTKQTIRSGGTSVEGTVISVDPCNTLILQTSEALLEFPAATSTIVTSC
ncbi:MAG: biotin--[acetyl-CoA-carboxylase] ligase [Phycisphaerales bacterium]|jgi:BirA family biotin operon repressor/biotin-[acetyl-CoA-carboxylase] ligase